MQNNFNKLLMQELSNNSVNNFDNVCLISNEELEHDHITFSCKHKFNYIPIYNEIKKQKNHIIQKKYNYLEVQKLSKYQMKCPYCRKIQDGILPPKKYIDIIKYVNWPKSKILKINTCNYIFKSVKHKSLKCNKKCVYNYCDYHEKIINNKNKKSYSTKTKCTAKTKKLLNCKRNAIENSTYCCQHHNMYIKNTQNTNT